MINLLHGDCLDLMSGIKDHSVDMIFTDLPYGTTQNRWDTVIDLEALWQHFTRIITEKGCIALWAQEPFTTQLIMSNPKMFRYKWIVEKTSATGFLNANRMPLKSYEEVLIFYKHLSVYNPIKTHGHERKISGAKEESAQISTNYGAYQKSAYDSTDRFPRDIVTFRWDKQKSAVHPTQKPVSACEYFISTYTDEGDLVLDATMGSSTTGVACKNLNRNFIGIEKEAHYFTIAQERIGI